MRKITPYDVHSVITYLAHKDPPDELFGKGFDLAKEFYETTLEDQETFKALAGAIAFLTIALGKAMEAYQEEKGIEFFPEETKH